MQVDASLSKLNEKEPSNRTPFWSQKSDSKRSNDYITENDINRMNIEAAHGSNDSYNQSKLFQRKLSAIRKSQKENISQNFNPLSQPILNNEGEIKENQSKKSDSISASQILQNQLKELDSQSNILNWQKIDIEDSTKNIKDDDYFKSESECKSIVKSVTPEKSEENGHVIPETQNTPLWTPICLKSKELSLSQNQEWHINFPGNNKKRHEILKTVDSVILLKKR